MDEGKVEVEAVGESGGTLGASGVGRDDDGVLVVEVLADVAEGEGLSVKTMAKEKLAFIVLIQFLASSHMILIFWASSPPSPPTNQQRCK